MKSQDDPQEQYMLRRLDRVASDFALEQMRSGSQFGEKMLCNREQKWLPYSYLPAAIDRLDMQTILGGGVQTPIVNRTQSSRWILSVVCGIQLGGLVVPSRWERFVPGEDHGFSRVLDLGKEDHIILHANDIDESQLRRAFNAVDLGFGYQAYILENLEPKTSEVYVADLAQGGGGEVFGNVLAAVVGAFDSQGFLIMIPESRHQDLVSGGWITGTV
jgi:hypothetical protein